MKKRIITLTLSILAVVLLVGVGFASWVISSGAKEETTGNILVETVHDKRLGVSVSEASGAIQFGSPEGSTSAGKWLYDEEVAGGETYHENLSVTFTVTVTRSTPFTDDEKAALTITPELSDKLLNVSDAEEDYPTAFFQKDGTGIAASAWTFAPDNLSATSTVTVTLKWGSLFNYQNPYDYFNVQGVNAKIGDVATAAAAAGLAVTADSTWGNYALAALQAIRAFNSYKFQVTINVA